MRLAAMPGVTPQEYRLAAAFLMTTRGIPQLTWGGEIGLPGSMNDRRDFPGGYPGDPRDAFSEPGRTKEERATHAAWRALIQLRRDSMALRRGDQVDLVANESTYVYMRRIGDEKVVVVLNMADADASLELGAAEIGAVDRAELLFGSGRARPMGQGIRVEAPPVSAAVYQLKER
jgi:glycosidase